MTAPDASPAPEAAAAARRCALLPQALTAVACGAYAAGAAVGWGSPFLALAMGDFGLAVAALCAFVSCLRYAASERCAHRAPWLLFALSSLMLCAGNAVWGWYEVVLRRDIPQTSVADGFFLLFAPSAITGLLLLARRPVSRTGWLCLLLDSWLIAGSLLTLIWSMALAHTAADAPGGMLLTGLTLAYPLLDIALVSAVLVLHLQRSAGVRAGAVNTVLAALAVTVLCDTLFTSPAVQDSYRSGGMLDAGWFTGSMLMAYAPWVGARRPTPPPVCEPARGGTGPIAALTPYLAVAVCLLSILYSTVTGGRTGRFVLLIAGMVGLALVVRQAIVLLDNLSLTRELAGQEAHFRSLVQGSSDVIMIATPRGVLRYVSPAAQGVYGRSPQELEGTRLSAMIHPEDRGRVLWEIRRFLAAALTAPPPEALASAGQGRPAGEAAAIRIECRIRSGDGSWLNVESTVSRHRDGLILNSRDVTERVRLQAQLQYNASHDPLTQLPNRSLFAERVRQAVSGRRADDGTAAVLFIDLDGFKAVNDSIGHQAGDELLVQAARRLSQSVRAGDTVARFGGDEFAALVRGGSADRGRHEQQIREIADRLRRALSQPYRVRGAEVRVSASIGVAFAEPGTSPDELMRNADLAMYRAKTTGKNRVAGYAPHLQAEMVRRLELAGRLTAALDRGELTLLHQPVVDLATGEIVAVEAQPRWSTSGPQLTPEELIHATEDADRAAELGRWVVEAAARQAADRHRSGQDTPIAVRVFGQQLLEDEPVGCRVENVLARHGLPAEALILVLAEGEHAPASTLPELAHRLAALKRLGVRLALDSFGAGPSGLHALRRLPVDLVRIDRGFVEGVVTSPRVRALTEGMLNIASGLGVATIAEGVDLPEQALLLRSLGCTHAQGRALSGPLDERRLSQVLALRRMPVPQPAGGSLPPRQSERAAAAQPAALAAGTHRRPPPPSPE